MDYIKEANKIFLWLQTLCPNIGKDSLGKFDTKVDEGIFLVSLG